MLVMIKKIELQWKISSHVRSTEIPQHVSYKETTDIDLFLSGALSE